MKYLLLAALLALGACTKKGCTDPLATNYNEKAGEDDGSCFYGNIYTASATHQVSFTAQGNTYVSEFTDYNVTQQVIDQGYVTVKVNSSDGWVELPFTNIVGASTHTWNVFYSLNTVKIVVESNDGILSDPGSLTVKVITGEEK